MKQRFLSVITIGFLLFSYSSQLFSMGEVLAEGATSVLEETLGKTSAQLTEEFGEEAVAQAVKDMTEQMASKAESMLAGLEGTELEQAQQALKDSMTASLKEQMDEMGDSLAQGLKDLQSKEGTEIFSGLGSKIDGDFMAQSTEDFEKTLTKAGIEKGSTAFDSLTQKFSTAQEALAGEVSGGTASLEEAGLEAAGGTEKSGIKTLSQANKEAISAARKTLSENDVAISKLNKVSSAAEGAVQKANEAAEGLAKDMKAVDELAGNAEGETDAAFEKTMQDSKKTLLKGKSLKGMSEDAISKFNKMSPEEQASVVERSGMSKDAFEEALQGKGGRSGFKKALLSVGVEDAMGSAMKDVEAAAEGAGNEAASAAVKNLRSSLEDAFSSSEESLMSGSKTEFATAVEDATSEVSSAVEGATTQLSEHSEKLMSEIAEKGGYDWVTKVSRKFATTSEAMSSKFEAMSDSLEESGVKGGAKKVGEYGVKGVKGIGKFLGGIGHTLFQAVLFMIPNIFESAFLAQKQRNALLKTYAAPIKFGNVVLQMPDSVFDMDEPQNSKFIYYGIPVDAVGAAVTSEAAAKYPGVTGPDINNKVSAGIHDDLAKMINPVSMVDGSSGSGIPKRYNLSDDALRDLPIYVSYTNKSWGKWGQVGISDPQFTDMMINLNTGYVFFADGQSDQTPAAPLTGHEKTMTVETFLSHKMGELQTAGGQYHFTEYVDTTESSASEPINPAIVDQFNCSCLDSGSKQDLSDLNKRCKTSKGAETCLLKKTLNQMSAGVSIDSRGRQLMTSKGAATTTSISTSSNASTTGSASYRSSVLGKLSSTPSLASGSSSGSSAATTNAESNVATLTADSYDMAEDSLINTPISIDTIKQGIAGTLDATPGTVLQEIAAGALGPVIPIQGYGDKFEDFLDDFPGGAQMALATPGAFTVSLSSGGLSLGGSSSSSSSSVEKIEGAPPGNYAAEGIYVYQCANTHFARMLKQQAAGSKKMSAATIAATYYIHDYVVFFDENLNQVPLTAAVESKDDYYFCDMQLNPDIKYYVSLIGAELSQMQVHPWDEVEAEIERVATSYRAAKTTEDRNEYNTLYQELMNQRHKLAESSLPRSFVPLYSLETDIFGMPKISYHQDVGSKVTSIISALKQHPQLGQQFIDIKNALHNLFYQGPFGPQQLVAVPDDMQATVQNIKLVFYQNFNAYPIPKHDVGQDSSGKADATLYNDILLPIKAVRQSDGSVKAQTAVLPEAVSQYRGLVSDIVYTVESDGSIQASDFSNSPFSVTKDGSKTLWHLNSSKVDSYYWMDFIEKLGGDGFTLPTALSDAVQERRAAWIAFIKQAMGSKFSKEELSGIDWSDTGMTLQISGQSALSKGLYLYTCSPAPTGDNLDRDYFVLTDSLSPSPTSSKLGKVSALNATDDYNLLSVVSGQLYDSFGDPVQDNSGNNVVVDAATLLQTLQVKSDVAANIYSSIAAEQAALAKKANKPVYPVSEFGAMQLGMYHADIVSGTYVYFDASGMTPGAEPTDYFITVDMTANPVKWQEEVSSKTVNMMSLISGKVIERGRQVQTHLASNKIDSVISSLSQNWRAALTQKVTALRAAAKAEKAAQEGEQDKIDQIESNLTKGSISWTSSEVLNYIANIKSAPFLASPHGSLKQDPASKQYILVSPASTDGSAFLYTFFNVANSYKDAAGNPIQVAAMYDDKATLMRVIEGVQLSSLRSQYGVSVDSAGVQKLGATNLQPPMIMADEDVSLKAGGSGVTMLCSNNKFFPSKGVASPVTYNGAKYYFYYNTVMKAYYVREVKTGVDRYISMAGGNIYNVDGSCAVASYPVAINKNSADDLLLPYLNGDSYTQCYMMNPSSSNKIMNFVNLESEFKGNLKFKSSNSLAALNVVIAENSPCNSVNVVQMPRPETIPPMPALDVATQYNVYWDNASPTVYKVQAGYAWQDLRFLPVNMSTGQPLTASPAEQYQHLKMVMNKGALTYVLFGGELYKLSQKSSEGVYSLAPVADSNAVDITVSMKQDSNTKVNYVQVAAGALIYNYQYLFDVLDDEQLESYRENVWKADTVADVNARILLAKDLPLNNGSVSLLPVSLNSVINLPSTQSEQAVFSGNLGRIMYDSVNNRYLGTVFKSGGSTSQGPFYQYFDEDGYVDLETGILFDSNGVPALYTLHLNDLLALLDKLSVAVLRVDGTAKLSYRTATAIQTEESALKQSLTDEKNLEQQGVAAVQSSQSSNSSSTSSGSGKVTGAPVSSKKSKKS